MLDSGNNTKGLKSIDNKTNKLSEELKELIKIVNELEDKLNNKMIELDEKMKVFDELINHILND